MPAPIASSALQRPSGSASVHLDALRGVGALIVLIDHWRGAFFLDYNQVPHNNRLLTAAYVVSGWGHAWVIMFFTLSGYLVGQSVLRSVENGRWSWRSYLLMRLSRFYVVLLPALLLGGILDWIGLHLVRGSDALYSGRAGINLVHFNVHETLSFPALMSSLTFLQTISLPWMGGVQLPAFGSNGVLWSLCNEFWYYIAFPLLVLGLKKGQRWQARVGYGIAFLALIWFVGPRISELGLTWLMGVAVPYLPAIRLQKPGSRKLIVAAALTLYMVGVLVDKVYTSFGTELMMGVLVTLLIWVFVHCATESLPAGYVWFAQRTGRSSYSLYLTHIPLMILMVALLHLPRVYPPDGRVYWISIIVLPVLFIYGQVVYEIFEKNTDRARKWIEPYVLGRKAAR